MTELETKIETEDFADELSDEALDREDQGRMCAAASGCVVNLR